MIYENEVTWKRDVLLPETVIPEQEYRLDFFSLNNACLTKLCPSKQA